MFQVQRFTTESDSDQGDDNTTSSTAAVTQKDVLLNRLLERARSKAKRARVEAAASADGSNGAAGSQTFVGAASTDTGVGVAHQSKAARYVRHRTV